MLIFYRDLIKNIESFVLPVMFVLLFLFGFLVIISVSTVPVFFLLALS